MFSDIAGVRKALKARLSPELPQNWPGWEISEQLRQPPTEYRQPLITFEFSRFESSVGGQDLARGQVAAAVDIVLGSPMTADGTGEDDIDQLVLTLIQIIDAQDDIFWSAADKERLPAGQWAWRIHTNVLTNSKE